MKSHKSMLKMVLAALFLALAYIMPFLTGQIPEVGAMLCPLHIPVLLCGFICGWPWGLAVGFVAPLLRSLILGMPPMFPTAICMAFELAVYGGVAGFLQGGTGPGGRWGQGPRQGPDPADSSPSLDCSGRSSHSLCRERQKQTK